MQLEQQCLPQLPITAPFQKSSSLSNVWLFKPGLSILGEMNPPEEEGLICQGFIATALQLHGGGGGLEAGVEGVGEGTGTAGWECRAEPSSAGGCGGCLALPACSSPEGLPMWAAAWAEVCRCELYAETSTLASC